MKQYQLVIIGGGSAGLAAAISAYEQGVRDILVLERDTELGGILQQCIHNGFGLHMFQEELSGPAYAQRYIEKLAMLSLTVKVQTMVTHLSADKCISYVNAQEGYVQIQANAVILAMGCRERTRGAIALPGYRPSGIWSAGTAQRYLNMEGYLVGKRIFILGSGDIGLIMARRMTLEGATVLGVAELMPYSNGLPRNLKQCLDDFNIPLYLSHTITGIHGQGRVSGITISQVDEKLAVIEHTEKFFAVDTLLLSVGLIPENGLSEEAHIEMHPKTKGPLVNESYETSVPGIFACGNVLHVHDLVDFVSQEGAKAGCAAKRYLMGELNNEEGMQCTAKGGVSYVMPAIIRPQNIEKTIELLYRVSRPMKHAVVRLVLDGNVIMEIKKPHLAPAEMEKLIVTKEKLLGGRQLRLEAEEQS